MIRYLAMTLGDPARVLQAWPIEARDNAEAARLFFECLARDAHVDAGMVAVARLARTGDGATYRITIRIARKD